MRQDLWTISMLALVLASLTIPACSSPRHQETRNELSAPITEEYSEDDLEAVEDEHFDQCDADNETEEDRFDCYRTFTPRDYLTPPDGWPTWKDWCEDYRSDVMCKGLED